MKKRVNPILSPRNATTMKRLCALKRDNMSFRDFWVLVDTDTVTLAHQENGKAAKAMITMPRRVFNHFVKFYEGEV